MRGAVAAGHPLTAQAGAEVLAEGGNAVDACIAAAFVSWVWESTLTGPGGGRRAGRGAPVVRDASLAGPARARDSARAGRHRADEIAGLPPRHPRPDPAPHTRGRGDLR